MKTTTLSSQNTDLLSNQESTNRWWWGKIWACFCKFYANLAEGFVL